MINVARDSLRNNKAAAIIANDLSGINKDQHPALLVSAENVQKLESNQEIAQAIFERVSAYDN